MNEGSLNVWSLESTWRSLFRNGKTVTTMSSKYVFPGTFKMVFHSKILAIGNIFNRQGKQIQTWISFVMEWTKTFIFDFIKTFYLYFIWKKTTVVRGQSSWVFDKSTWKNRNYGRGLKSPAQVFIVFICFKVIKPSM